MVQSTEFAIAVAIAGAAEEACRGVVDNAQVNKVLHLLEVTCELSDKVVAYTVIYAHSTWYLLIARG